MALQEQFDFYMTLAKPLALSLTNTDCRARVCAWLKYLQDCEDSQLRVDYIKLLMFVIQKNNLLGPFSEVPPTDGSLARFPDNASLSKMMLRVTEKVSGQVGAGDSKPEVSEFISTDLKQFVALQSLPGDRGIQCYMALGADEMNKWEQTSSSSCSCNNLSNSERMAPHLEHLQPATHIGVFPPRYSPMIRYQRQRRRMDQLQDIPPNYQPLSVEPAWIPTKTEVYWLKRMNKMMKRAGGPDTIFMDDVNRYYAQADRSQTTDEDWDPFQNTEDDESEYSPDMMPPPGAETQFSAKAEEFVDALSDEPSLENMRLYRQPTNPNSPQQQTGPWMKPTYQDTNDSYESETVPYMSGCSPLQTCVPPSVYNTSQLVEEEGMMRPNGTRTPSPSKPRWAKKTLELDFGDQGEKFYPSMMENPESRVHYDMSYNDPDYTHQSEKVYSMPRETPQSRVHSDYSQPHPFSSYGSPQGPRPFPGGSRGPPGPGIFPQRPPSPSPGSDLERDPSRIVVFHCKCACKK